MLIGSVNSIDMEITRGLALPTVQVVAKSSPTQVFDFSTYALDAKIYDVEGGSVLATFTVTIVDAANGKFSLDLSAASTATIPTANTTGYFLMTATASGGDPKPWARGSVRFRG